jgi:hypothetical protein
LRGQTKGVWVAHLPVALALQAVEADTRQQRFPPKLAKALKALDRDGTFVIFDTEGDDELGQSTKAIRMLQLMTLDMSSHVLLTIGKQLGNEEKANVLALVEQMRIIGALNTPCDPEVQAALQRNFGAKHLLNDDSSNNGGVPGPPAWTSVRPALTILPRDNSGLLGEFLSDGSIEVNHLQRVVRVHPHATLDATAYFEEIKAPTGHSLATQLKSLFRDPRYQANFAPPDAARIGALPLHGPRARPACPVARQLRHDVPILAFYSAGGRVAHLGQGAQRYPLDRTSPGQPRADHSGDI